MRRTWLPALLLLAACQDDPALAGGFDLSSDGRMFFLRDGLLFVTLDPEFRARPAQITSGYVRSPELSENSRSLLWGHPVNDDGTARWVVTTLDRATGERSQVTPPRFEDNYPTWSEDGSELFVRRRSPSNEFTLVRLARDGAVRHQFTTDSALYIQGIDWDRRRHRLLVSFEDRGKSGDRLEIMADDGDERSVLVPAVEAVYYEWPAWSPNGQQFAVMRQDYRNSTGVQSVVIFNAAGEEQHSIIAEWPVHLTWSPDGSRVAYCQYVPGSLNGRREIRIWSPGGAITSTITPTGMSDCEPTWGR